jgi:hypothetical protein
MTKVRPVQLSAFPDLAPDKPTGRILPSVFVGTNADLMAAVAPYYLTGSVCDVTYGEGNWWTRFTPDPFTYHDLHKVDGVDFRALPEADSSIDTVCFDPPYVISGTHSSDRLGDGFQNRYGIGLHNLPIMPSTSDGVSAFEHLIVGGLAECIRVARSWVLVKCMEFSQGNHVPPARSFHDIPHLVTTTALTLDCLKHDQIVHHTGSGPGGHNIFDPKRARRHHSYLLVFAKRGVA